MQGNGSHSFIPIQHLLVFFFPFTKHDESRALVHVSKLNNAELKSTKTLMTS